MYSYETEKQWVFTDEGQRQFLRVRDHVAKCLKLAGVVRMQEATAPISGDNWSQMACVDRLVELGELVEIQTDGASQHRVFRAASV